MKISRLALLTIGIAAFACSSVQAVVIDGTLARLGGTTPVGDPYPEFLTVTTTVDHVYFTVNTGGIIDFDMLSWESTSDGFDPGAPVDLNGDGEIAFFDPVIYLFNDDGSLDVGDLITFNDDSALGTDGSVLTFDSFLSVDLISGNYLLAIGSYSVTAAEAIGTSSASRGPASHLVGDPAPIAYDHGDWRLTMSGDVTVTRVRTSTVPEPTALALLGLGLAGFGFVRRKKLH